MDSGRRFTVMMIGQRLQEAQHGSDPSRRSKVGRFADHPWEFQKSRHWGGEPRGRHVRSHIRPCCAMVLPLYSCPDCGGPVTNPTHAHCEACNEAGLGLSVAVQRSRDRAVVRSRARLSATGARLD